MAKWIYFYKEMSSTYSITTSVTAFPLYNSSLGDYILTEATPGNNFIYRLYDDGAFWRHEYAQLLVGGKSLIESVYNEAVSRYTGYTYEVIPNKLLRVETETNLSSLGTQYEEKSVQGRFLIKSLAEGLPNACLVPVHFTVRGVVYDGFGNYDDSRFKYTSNSSYSGGDTSRVHSFISDTTKMPVKYLTKSKDNRVVRTDISVGDIIDFGETPQNIPSVLRNWLDICTEDVTDTTVTEPIHIPLKTPVGVQLHSANRYSPFDIIVNPVLQEKTITQNGDVFPDSGYAGLGKVTVDVPIPEGYIVPEGSLKVEESGTYDVTKFASVEVTVSGEAVEVWSADDIVIKDITLIGFTIDGTEYQAVEGMTWAEWVDSEYNTDGYGVEAHIITRPVFEGQTPGYISGASISDTIIADHAYSTQAGGGAGN